MNMYKAGCLLAVAGLLAGCASTNATPPCNCQPAKTVYVPVNVKKPVKPVEKPIISEKPEPKLDANGNVVAPVPPKKPSKLQKLREDIKKLKDEYLRKKSGSELNQFRG